MRTLLYLAISSARSSEPRQVALPAAQSTGGVPRALTLLAPARAPHPSATVAVFWPRPAHLATLPAHACT